MVKVVGQDISADYYNRYGRSLGQSTLWKGKDTPVFGVAKFGTLPFGVNTKIHTVRVRQPYRLPHMKTNSGNSPSGAQKEVRAAFKKCVECFNASPKEGGVEPPAIGYRSHEWWYEQAGLATYAPYIGEDFHTWDGEAADPYQLKDTNYTYHDANWFLKTDEADFVDFYNEMKTKYGYPWSPKNNPDQIVTKMNQIVCNEIEYDHEGDMTVCFTPGQTAQARKGVCDDQSALHYALTWKALKELEWTDEQINNRLGCIVNEQTGQGHMYNWWKANTGTTKIIENTYDPGESPKVIGDMAYWGEDMPKFLTQRFSKEGHFKPVFIANGVVKPLWYYNYFIQQTWAYFYGDEIPDWCGAVVQCDHVSQKYQISTAWTDKQTLDIAWAAAWAEYQELNWQDITVDNVLDCNGSLWNNGEWYCKAKITVSKETLIFKPEEHMSQKKWDEIEIIKLMFYRAPYNPGDTVGGGIKLVETNETQDQVHNWMTFYIPKSICNFEEFSITLEGLCRTSDDLRPPDPPIYNWTFKGSNTQISNAKLYCA